MSLLMDVCFGDRIYEMTRSYSPLLPPSELQVGSSRIVVQPTHHGGRISLHFFHAYSSAVRTFCSPVAVGSTF